MSTPKVAILAGGMGSRFFEETQIKPKPMIEIGGKPILWHIMKHFSRFALDEFVIALGYRGDCIKRYMVDSATQNGSMTVDFRSGNVIDTNSTPADPWTVQLVPTGLTTATGGRIKQLEPYLGNNTFMLTWGDGVADVDLHALLEFHRSHGRLATVTAVRPPARFGRLHLDGDRVERFAEKQRSEEGWINGAFFVLEPGIFRYIQDNQTQWEQEPMEQLAADGQLMAFRHEGYWQCMDTVRDWQVLQQQWESGNAPWKTWSA